MRSGACWCQGLPVSAPVQTVHPGMKLERWKFESGGGLPDGCDAVLRDGARQRVLWLMAEFFQTLGYSDVKARLPGHTAPTLLNGTLEDHRPDLTCRQRDSGRTPVLLEVVLPLSLIHISEPTRL